MLSKVLLSLAALVVAASAAPQFPQQPQFQVLIFD